MKATSAGSRSRESHRPTARALPIVLLAGLIVLAGCSPNSSPRAVPTALPAVPDLPGVTVEGRLEPIHFVKLALNSDGLVGAVLASQGEQVAAGQLIARLDNTQTQTLDDARSLAAVGLGRAQEAVRVAQKELDVYPLPRVFVGLTSQQAAQIWLAKLDAARADFRPYDDTSRKTLKPNHHIFPSLPRRVWFDTGEYSGMAKEYNKELDVAWMNYRKAVEWLVLDSALQTAQARLLQAQRHYDGLTDSSLTEMTAGIRGALANSELRAPFRGTLTNFDIKLGEHVSSGKPVVTIGDFSSWVVKTTNLTEIDVVKVAEGEPVKVTLDAVPGRVFDGTVLTIDLNYSERQGDIVYTATILLREHEPQMRWGMTAKVTFAD